MAIIIEQVADYERKIVAKLRAIAGRGDARDIRAGLLSAMGPHAEYEVAERTESFERLKRRIDDMIVDAWILEREIQLDDPRPPLAERMRTALLMEANHIELTLSRRTITLTPYDGPESDQVEILDAGV